MTTIDPPPGLQSCSHFSQYVTLIQAYMTQQDCCNVSIVHSRFMLKQEKQLSRHNFQTLKNGSKDEYV